MPSKELIDKIKNEAGYIGVLLVVAVIVFKIAFYKEDLFVVFRVVASLFWFIIIPCFFIMYYWHDKLRFVERFIVGAACGAAIMSISSYYLGIIGLHVKYHIIFLPIFYIIVGFLLLRRK